jgi:hypothetical protein
MQTPKRNERHAKHPKVRQTAIFVIDVSNVQNNAQAIHIWSSLICRVLTLLCTDQEVYWGVHFFNASRSIDFRRIQTWDVTKDSFKLFNQMAKTVLEPRLDGDVPKAQHVKQAISLALMKSPWTNPDDINTDFTSPNMAKRRKVLKHSLVQHITKNRLTQLPILPKATILNHLFVLSSLKVDPCLYFSCPVFVGKEAAQAVSDFVLGSKGSFWAHVMEARCQVSWIDTTLCEAFAPELKVPFGEMEETMLEKWMRSAVSGLGGVLIPASHLLMTNTFPEQLDLDVDKLDLGIPQKVCDLQVGRNLITHGLSLVSSSTQIMMDGQPNKWIRLKSGRNESDDGFDEWKAWEPSQSIQSLGNISLQALKSVYFNSKKESVWFTHNSQCPELYKQGKVGILRHDNHTLLLFPLAFPMNEYGIVRVVRPEAKEKIMALLDSPAMPNDVRTFTSKALRDVDWKHLKMVVGQIRCAREKQQAEVQGFSTLALESAPPSDILVDSHESPEQQSLPQFDNWNDAWNWLQNLVQELIGLWSNASLEAPATVIGNVVLDMMEKLPSQDLLPLVVPHLCSWQEFERDMAGKPEDEIVSLAKVKLVWLVLAMSLSHHHQSPLPPLEPVPKARKKKVLYRLKPKQVDPWHDRLVTHAHRLWATHIIAMGKEISGNADERMLGFHAMLSDERWRQLGPIVHHVVDFFAPDDQPVPDSVEKQVQTDFDDDFVDDFEDYFPKLVPGPDSRPFSSRSDSQSSFTEKRPIPIRQDSQSSNAQPRSDSSTSSNIPARVIARGMFANASRGPTVLVQKKAKSQPKQKKPASFEVRRENLQNRELLLPGQEWGKGLRVFGQTQSVVPAKERVKRESIFKKLLLSPENDGKRPVDEASPSKDAKRRKSTLPPALL